MGMIGREVRFKGYGCYSGLRSHSLDNGSINRPFAICSALP